MSILSECLFLQNYFPHIWSHTWSLAVEEHFYLFIGLLVAVLATSRSSRPFRFICLLFPVIASILLLARVGTATTLPFKYSTHLYPTYLRVDALLFGVLLSYYHHFNHEWPHGKVLAHRRAIVLCSAAFIFPCLVLPIEQSKFMQTIGLTLLYLGYGGILITAINCEQCRTGNSRSLTKLFARVGVYSYSIYLWHLPIQKYSLLLGTLFFENRPPFLVLSLMYLGGSLLVGIVLSKAIEIPVLHLRDRLIPSRVNQGPSQSCSALDLRPTSYDRLGQSREPSTRTIELNTLR